MKNQLLIFCFYFFLQPIYAADLDERLLEVFKNEFEEFSELRRYLHQNAELKYQEIVTSSYVAKKLVEFGHSDAQLQTEVAETGVIAILDSGIPGKTVALRADMDALPIIENTGLPYASKNRGVMHACGHDGHTATLLMVAKILKQGNYLSSGRIKFIFQPAEEGGYGAQKMIEQGALKDVDAIFGYHNFPKIPKNAVAVRSGCIMAAADVFEIYIKGKSGHGAHPENAINPIVVSASITLQLYTLPAKNKATEPVVISICSSESNTKTHNVIPETVELKGTLRTTSPSSRAKLRGDIENLCSLQGKIDKAEVAVKYTSIGFPPTMNTAQEADLVLTTAREFLPKESVITLQQPEMTTEDFSLYLEKIPGCFFFVGIGEDAPDLHSDKYDFNDEILPMAAAMLAKIALKYLR